MVRIRISRTPRVDVVTRKNLALAHPVGQNPDDHLPWSKTGVVACHFCNPENLLRASLFFPFFQNKQAHPISDKSFQEIPRPIVNPSEGDIQREPPHCPKDSNCTNSLLENTQFFCTSVCATNFSRFALNSPGAFPRLHASMQHPSSRNPTRGARPQHAGISPCRSSVGRVC